MFTFYKDISGLTLHSSEKLGFDSIFLMEIFNQFNILDMLLFLKNIENYFNIPLFSDIITSDQYIYLLRNPKQNQSKHYLITRFIQIIKNYFLFENVFTLIINLFKLKYLTTKKINLTNIFSLKSFKPLLLGQVYGHYQGSVLPFYINTSSWYIRTGLLADEKLLIIITIIQTKK